MYDQSAAHWRQKVGTLGFLFRALREQRLANNNTYSALSHYVHEKGGLGPLERSLACMVPEARLELARCCQRWILSPLRLPIPPHPQNCFPSITYLSINCNCFVDFNDNVKKSDIGDSVSASAPVVAKQAPLAPSNPNNYVVRGSSLSLFLRIRKTPFIRTTFFLF